MRYFCVLIGERNAVVGSSMVSTTEFFLLTCHVPSVLVYQISNAIHLCLLSIFCQIIFLTCIVSVVCRQYWVLCVHQFRFCA